MIHLTSRLPVGVAVPVALALVLVACGERPSASTIEAAELERRIASDAAPLVLDVRTPSEYAAGHVPGAVLIPHDQLPMQLERVREYALVREHAGAPDEIVVYCERGGRASVAEQVLEDAGFTAVRHLDGDMSGWREEERPVETGAAETSAAETGSAAPL